MGDKLRAKKNRGKTYCNANREGKKMSGGGVGGKYEKGGAVVQNYSNKWHAEGKNERVTPCKWRKGGEKGDGEVGGRGKK